MQIADADEIRQMPTEFNPEIALQDDGVVAWRDRGVTPSGQTIDVALGYCYPGSDVQDEIMRRHLKVAAWQSLELVRLGRHDALRQTGALAKGDT